jgi:hypothetical protein
MADAADLKVRSGQSFFRVILKPCGRGGIGRRIGLKRKNLSARRETGGAELLKVGEPCNMAIPSQARPETGREGVETRRAAPNTRSEIQAW